MFRGTRRPAGGARLPLLVASGLAVVALTGCGGAGPDAQPGTVGSSSASSSAAGRSASGVSASARVDFTHGVPSKWEQRHATVEHGAGDPSAWVRLDAAGTPAFVSLPPAAIPHRTRRFHFSGRFRVRSRAPAQTVGLATVENSAKEHHADLFVDARTGRCRVDLFSDDTALSPGPCDDGAWHRVTMTGRFGTATYRLAWTVDGVRMPAIRSTGQTPATVHRLWLGDATPAKTNVTDWTDVSLELR